MQSHKNIYNQLKRDLGESDACCEYIEVLFRAHEKEGLTEEELIVMSNEAGIKVDSFDFQKASRIVRESYILTVHQRFEVFLYELKSIIAEFCVGFRAKEDKEPILDCIYRNIFDLRKKNNEIYVYYLICDYYRLIRNQNAHLGKQNDAENTYREIVERKESILQFTGKLGLPNSFDKLGFNDFVIFSRAVKKLAQEMIKNLNYDEKRIAEKFDIKVCKKYSKESQRCRDSVRHALEVQFDLNGEKLEDTVQMILDRVSAEKD